MMDFDYSKRGFLLPPGCKDLIDVINLERPKVNSFWVSLEPSNQPAPAKGNILISEWTTIGELAAELGQKPFKIIADLMQLGVFATVKQPVDFEMVCQIAKRYGYTVKRLG